MFHNMIYTVLSNPLISFHRIRKRIVVLVVLETWPPDTRRCPRILGLLELPASHSFVPGRWDVVFVNAPLYRCTHNCAAFRHRQVPVRSEFLAAFEAAHVAPARVVHAVHADAAYEHCCSEEEGGDDERY